MNTHYIPTSHQSCWRVLERSLDLYHVLVSDGLLEAANFELATVADILVAHRVAWGDAGLKIVLSDLLRFGWAEDDRTSAFVEAGMHTLLVCALPKNTTEEQLTVMLNSAGRLAHEEINSQN